MAEEALNLSLDDIIKRNADNNKQTRGGSGAAKRGGRGSQGSRNSNRISSFQPRVQTRVVKTTRGRGAGRGPARLQNVGISNVYAALCLCSMLLNLASCTYTEGLPADREKFPQRCP